MEAKGDGRATDDVPLDIYVGVCLPTQTALLAHTSAWIPWSPRSTRARTISTHSSQTDASSESRQWIDTWHLRLDFVLEADSYVIDLCNDSFAACTERLDRCEFAVGLNLEQGAWFEWMRYLVPTEEDTGYRQYGAERETGLDKRGGPTKRVTAVYPFVYSLPQHIPHGMILLV